MTKAPHSMAVIGGGRMGAGIAHVFANAATTVTVVESDDTAAAAAHERVVTGLRRAEERNALTASLTEVAARIEFISDPRSLPTNVQLVVEAVPEKPELKIDVLSRVEEIIGADTVLATNTSSLSIGELATALHAPWRFVGMHFFNPVPVSDLVEVVVGPHTTDSHADATADWVRALGKTEVLVHDSPGFATSRLGVTLGLEAIRMLQEGVADARSIDTAMELGYRHPMGPLRSTDLVGLDVRLAVADYLRSRLGERFAAPNLLRDKVARDELGRKTGKGFYDWE